MQIFITDLITNLLRVEMFAFKWTKMSLKDIFVWVKIWINREISWDYLACTFVSSAGMFGRDTSPKVNEAT